MVVYDLKEREFVIFSEKQKDKILASIFHIDSLKLYNVTLYEGWNDNCNVTEVMEALNVILEPEEELSDEDILRVYEDTEYGWNLKLGYNKYGLQVSYQKYYYM